MLAVGQKELCSKFNVTPCPTSGMSKLGISQGVRTSLRPIHGLRHAPTGDASGWFVWAGEYSEDREFFKPLHMSHLNEWRPEIEKFLALPPGWRFLWAENYEDVWFDPNLLNVEST
jgi:hypothetical protein